MALTAREWLLLPEDEQQRRKNELSPHECFLLRTDLEYIHFSEEEKKNISPEKIVTKLYLNTVFLMSVCPVLEIKHISNPVFRTLALPIVHIRAKPKYSFKLELLFQVSQN